MAWRDHLTKDEMALLAIIERKRQALRVEQQELTAQFNSLLARGTMRERRS